MMILHFLNLFLILFLHFFVLNVRVAAAPAPNDEYSFTGNKSSIDPIDAAFDEFAKQFSVPFDPYADQSEEGISVGQWFAAYKAVVKTVGKIASLFTGGFNPAGLIDLLIPDVDKTEMNNVRWKEARKLVNETKKVFKKLEKTISHGFEEIDRKLDIQSEQIKAEFYIYNFYEKVTSPARLLRFLAGKLMEIRPVEELKSIRSQFLYQCEFADTEEALKEANEMLNTNCQNHWTSDHIPIAAKEAETCLVQAYLNALGEMENKRVALSEFVTYVYQNVFSLAHMHGVCETTKNRNDTTWEGFVTEQLTEIVEGLQDHVKRALDSSG